MLKSLSIRNVVLIDKLDLDLSSGFTVLSGETGAGKSILLDSLGFLLGQRADVAMIRQGCDKLVVNAVFECQKKNETLQHLCNEHDLDIGDEIMISRTLTQDGRGKIFFNDQPITLKLLKEIGGCLVEVHGQFDNQGLLNTETHLTVLDAYGNYGAVIGKVKQSFEDYKIARDEREKAEESLREAQENEENLIHWIKEFAQVKPQENELAELEQKRRYAMNSEKIIEGLQAAYNALYRQTTGVPDFLRQAQAMLARVNAVTEDKYAAIYEMLDTALVNTQEAAGEIESSLNEINLNQDEINALEERLFTLKDLARKHHTTVDELPTVWRELEAKIACLEHGRNDLSELQAKEAKAWENYKKQAQDLHQMRQEAAARLDAGVMSELPALKMEKAQFKTQITLKEENKWNERGGDEVCFLVSTNSGTPFGNLSKIASGGELSRFMLALKVNLGQVGAVETMIFDEVDAGIGGATAQAVGEKLAKLGKVKQVMVVTHSPQVAAFGEHHFKVEKFTTDGTTVTTVRLLSNIEKQEEIARMLSGEVISDEARAAARVLIGA
ncbi:MAG: DNA repair protein RecN [Alphaproteobacteria bacterium]|nr:DNA repair protein RecN [Alphaproteobacteria bacterium]